MAENKTTKEIYINASKVSHFTNFNRFTKENENIEILYEHNLWLRKFFHFTYKDPISEIINNLGDLEISSIKKEVCGSTDSDEISSKNIGESSSVHHLTEGKENEVCSSISR